MNKLILKTFELLKHLSYFMKILVIFFLALHLLFWIQNLINGHFGWLQIFTPILKGFLSLGAYFSNNSLDLFGSAFEYKYIIAVAIYLCLYYFFNFLITLLNHMEDKYNDAYRFVKKTNENIYNNSLKHKQEKEEKQINKYKVLILTNLKSKYSHPEQGFNLDEQNRIMNKFVIDKTGVEPNEYAGGFLYSFNNFSNIDSSLEIFFKLIKANSPLDFTICLQVVEGDELKCLEELKFLAGLKNAGKITMLSNTDYRYRFNKSHRYGTSQLGVFQKNNDTVELHEFIEI